MKIKEELYSPYKALHHLDIVEKLRKGEPVLPLHIQCDLTNRCAHDCVHCFYRGVNDDIVTSFDRKAQLPLETVKSLIWEMHYNDIPAIQITGGGEPLMYPHFRQVLDLINRTELELALVTNGVLLNQDIINQLTRASWIRVSIDAATSDTYAKVQRCSPKEFDKVVENVKLLTQHLPNTIIGASFIVSPDNYKEMYDAAALYKSLGVHNVRFSIAYTKEQTKLFKPFLNEMNELTNKARELNEDNFRVFALNTDHMIHLGQKKKYKKCWYSCFTAAIEANGDVRPCCTIKALPHSCFGNINDNSFVNIWFGEKRKKWFEHFDVQKCIRCWMDTKNEILDYVMCNDPMHVNYV